MKNMNLDLLHVLIIIALNNWNKGDFDKAKLDSAMQDLTNIMNMEATK